MIAIDRPVSADGGVLEISAFLLGDEHLNVVTQTSLVALEGEQ